MRKIKKTVLVVLSFVFLAGCSNYSAGERVGIITKFSYKGSIFKTWEGELLQGGLKTKMNSDGQTSSVANIFEFSIDPEQKKKQNNKMLIDSIQYAMETGMIVRLMYTQEFATDWDYSRGSTGYYITDIKIIR